MNFDMFPLWISFKTSITATIITFFIGIAAAHWLAFNRGRARWIIDGIFTLPMVLPPTVVGFFLLALFGKYGPIGKLLLQFDITVIFTWTATVIAATVVAFPLMYRTTRGAFEQVDENILNAARTLGLSEWEIFWKILVPMAWPGIASGTILSFARALGEFGATLMVAGNIPKKTQTIPVAIFFAAEGGQMDTALIWVLIIVWISMVVIFLMNYWGEFQRRYTVKSKKEA